MSILARKTKDPRGASDADDQDLLALAFSAGHTRLAVISLHPGAGARTVVETLTAEALERGIGIGVTSVPRVGLAAEQTERVTGVSLPEGAFVATACSIVDESDALDPLERIDCHTPLGEICICRMTRAAEVQVYGPDDPAALGAVVGRLEARSQGFVLVGGAWERHSFASPEVAQAVILAAGATYSGTLERSAAAVRHAVELFELSRYEVPVDRVLREAIDQSTSLALDRNGRVLAKVSTNGSDPCLGLELVGEELASVVLPDFLSDAFLAALVRSSVCCTLVVKDATRIRVSPVYLTAWLRGGGRVAVVEPMRVLAVATNPTNPTGPDNDARQFRSLIAETVPRIPVYDVRLDTAVEEEAPRWKFWG